MTKIDPQREILIHVQYIREHLDGLAKRAAEDRAITQRHAADDARQFEAIARKLNRIIGGLVLAGAVAGALVRVLLV